MADLHDALFYVSHCRTGSSCAQFLAWGLAAATNARGLAGDAWRCHVDRHQHAQAACVQVIGQGRWAPSGRSRRTRFQSGSLTGGVKQKGESPRGGGLSSVIRWLDSAPLNNRRGAFSLAAMSPVWIQKARGMSVNTQRPAAEAVRAACSQLKQR